MPHASRAGGPLRRASDRRDHTAVGRDGRHDRPCGQRILRSPVQINSRSLSGVDGQQQVRAKRHPAGLPPPTELLPFHLARGGRGTARAAWPPLPPRALAPAVFRLPSSIPCRGDTMEQLRDRLCHLMVHEVANYCDERLGSRHASSPCSARDTRRRGHQQRQARCAGDRRDEMPRNGSITCSSHRGVAPKMWMLSRASVPARESAPSSPVGASCSRR